MSEVREAMAISPVSPVYKGGAVFPVIRLEHEIRVMYARQNKSYPRKRSSPRGIAADGGLPLSTKKILIAAAQNADAWLKQSDKTRAAAESLVRLMADSSPLPDGSPGQPGEESANPAGAAPSKSGEQSSPAPFADKVAKQVRAVLDEINRLDQIHASGPGADPPIRREIAGILSSGAAERIGISRAPASGLWQLDESTIASAAFGGYAELGRLLGGKDGFAAEIGRKLAPAREATHGALIGASAASLHGFTVYNPSMKPYLQLQLNGLFVNGLS